MKLDDVYQSDTLKAADLKSREHTLCIATVESKDFNDGKKLIITFQNAKKQFIVNRTNAKRIAFAHGDDTDDWIGKEIVLYPDLVDFQGKVVEAIRVRPAVRSAPQSRPVPANTSQRPSLKATETTIVQDRGGYSISTGADPHPNAPGNDEMGDQEIPF